MITFQFQFVEVEAVGGKTFTINGLDGEVIEYFIRRKGAQVYVALEKTTGQSIVSPCGNMTELHRRVNMKINSAGIQNVVELIKSKEKVPNNGKFYSSNQI